MPAADTSISEGNNVQIRRMRDGEADAVAEVWHRSGQAAYPFIETWCSFSLEQARGAFRNGIAARCAVWVAEIAGEVVGFLALNGSYLDRLYVGPDHQGQGAGTGLLKKAMALSPDGLELHTHQKNTRACAFYEKNGFVPVKYGVSPPPESEPDVEFHWRPANNASRNARPS